MCDNYFDTHDWEGCCEVCGWELFCRQCSTDEEFGKESPCPLETEEHKTERLRDELSYRSIFQHVRF